MTKRRIREPKRHAIDAITPGAKPGVGFGICGIHVWTLVDDLSAVNYKNCLKRLKADNELDSRRPDRPLQWQTPPVEHLSALRSHTQQLRGGAEIIGAVHAEIARFSNRPNA